MPILTDALLAAALADIAPPAEARLVSGLAARAWYPDPTRRPVSDIDVVLPGEAALAELRRGLLRAGWLAVYDHPAQAGPGLSTRAGFVSARAAVDAYVDPDVGAPGSGCDRHTPLKYGQWSAAGCGYAVRFLLRRALAGMPAPEVDTKLAGDLARYAAAHAIGPAGAA